MAADSNPSRLETKPRQVEISLRDMAQLFNTMDPAPFQEKDLDQDAEEFIVSWTREFPIPEPLVLVVHLRQSPAEGNAEPTITDGIHNYFEYRARLNRKDFSHLMKEGRQSLLIGIAFLATCLAASEALPSQTPGTFLNLVRESLTIGGWVAMWRPLEIYLYEWWPLRRRGRLYEKLSQIKVEVRQPAS